VVGHITAPVVFFELLRTQRLGAHACERRNSALAGGTGCRRELDSLPQATAMPTVTTRIVPLLKLSLLQCLFWTLDDATG
jgi:hypothetical protein